jgi:ATP-dependent Clp protease ATP-binding subunit ClpA
MRELDFDLLRERLSPNAIRVVSISIEESRRRNHNFLSDEHILLALCKHEPELIDCSLCCDSIKLADLTAETKDSLDKMKPHVGRSLRMTPELQRILRIAWDNIQDKNRRHIETFDLLKALHQNGTSDVWQKIRQLASSEENIDDRLERYAKLYFEKEQERTNLDKEIELAEWQLNSELDNFVERVKHPTKQSQPSTFVWFGSFTLICAVIGMFVLAIIKC